MAVTRFFRNAHRLGMRRAIDCRPAIPLCSGPSALPNTNGLGYTQPPCTCTPAGRLARALCVDNAWTCHECVWIFPIFDPALRLQTLGLGSVANRSNVVIRFGLDRSHHWPLATDKHRDTEGPFLLGDSLSPGSGPCSTGVWLFVGRSVQRSVDLWNFALMSVSGIHEFRPALTSDHGRRNVVEGMGIQKRIWQNYFVWVGHFITTEFVMEWNNYKEIELTLQKKFWNG